jgi:hypothetical protein
MKAKKADGFCLRGPKGLVPDTFCVDPDTCWSFSFRYLYEKYGWMQPFYKKWDESIAAAEKHKFIIVPVHLSEAA